MWQTGYPLHVMHGYVIPAKEACDFSGWCIGSIPRRCRASRWSPMPRPAISGLCSARSRTCGADRAAARDCYFGARCSRGFLYSELSRRTSAKDGLIAARTNSISCVHARLRTARSSIAWTDRFMASSGLDESAEEQRLRHAACLLADIGWRAHPDYRGEQSVNIIANAAFVSVDHPGPHLSRACGFFRHVGLVDDELSPQLRELASTRHARSGTRAGRGAARCLSRFRLGNRACCRRRRWSSSTAG